MPAKRKIVAALVFVVAAASLSAQSNAFQGYLSGFLEDMNKNLPDSALAASTWSDGYIGQFLPLPPHFGVGLATGFSRFPVTALNNAFSQAGEILDISGAMGSGYLPLINPAIEVRVGGFALPFDLGFRFSMLPTNTLYDVELKYTSVALDLRYAIIQENLTLPEFVVGIGWYFISGGIGYEFSSSALELLGMSGDQRLGIDFNTNVFELRAQVSKSFLIFTPYLGITGYYALSKSSYEVLGIEDELSTYYFGSRIYGGCSFNILFARIDVAASYNFTTQNWGANIGARFQM